MTFEEIAKKRNLRGKKRDQLREIYMNNPERFMWHGVIRVPPDSRDIYLPDQRVKGYLAQYTHVMNAVALQQELIPNSISTTDDAVKVYLKDLCNVGMIQPICEGTTPVRTTDCVVTLKAGDWLKQQSKEHHAMLIETLKTIAPNGFIGIKKKSKDDNDD